jgi:hypothetical protein
MKSAMKNLRAHTIARSKHGEKSGFVYADVVDSLNDYVSQPTCAALPYYVSTCSNCLNYVHQCLNCVYDTPTFIPTVVPKYLLSTSYLPSLPLFPNYPDYVTPEYKDDAPQVTYYYYPYDYGQGTTDSTMPHADRVNALLDSMKSGLPQLEQGLYTIQTDVQKIQAKLPGGVTGGSWPGPNDETLSDKGTLDNIAQHTDVGDNGPHLNHILTVVNSIQHSIPEFQRDLAAMQSDMGRVNRYYVMSTPVTSDSSN